MTNTKTKRRAFLKITHLNEFIDLGEYEGSFKDIKKFLDSKIDIIITTDKKIITKYEDSIARFDKERLEDLKKKTIYETQAKSKICGFGNEQNLEIQEENNDE